MEDGHDDALSLGDLCTMYLATNEQVAALQRIGAAVDRMLVRGTNGIMASAHQTSMDQSRSQGLSPLLTLETGLGFILLLTPSKRVVANG
jgi:hypothetical protein